VVYIIKALPISSVSLFWSIIHSSGPEPELEFFVSSGPEPEPEPEPKPQQPYFIIVAAVRTDVIWSPLLTCISPSPDDQIPKILGVHWEIWPAHHAIQ
jgi:hypothetical protein